MYFIGYDIGSSSVKASLVDAQSGKCVSSAFYPKTEAKIIARRPGWAEQEPQSWWEYLRQATHEILTVPRCEIKAIGISWQMHGLVCIDKAQNVLRPSIIWCDSRAVKYGEAAFDALGKEFCLEHYLNSPGNFTASKLAWVRENEPELYSKIDKIMLPGDFIAMKLTGEVNTTVEALSEGILWDFKENRPSWELLDYFGFDRSILPSLVPIFGPQGEVCAAAAAELGLAEGTPITYRAGDQPNNALSLNVFNPGEIAATAGTSGVVYGVNSQVRCDPQCRFNTFAHVNHAPALQSLRDVGQCDSSSFVGSTSNPPSAQQSLGPQVQTRLGALLCINGTGILNSWIKSNMVQSKWSYREMDLAASKVPIGSCGLQILPFGNGAERVLGNKDIGCSIHGLNFNIHSQEHFIRAAHEGIVFAFKFGIDIMEQCGIQVSKIHAGNANMFRSPVVRETLASITGATIELYDTDGAEGAAKGAGIGLGLYTSPAEAFSTLKIVSTTDPDLHHLPLYTAAYQSWLENLPPQP